LRELPGADFRRLLGVKPQTYAAMLAAYERWARAKRKPGRPPALSLEEQLVLALEFWREYRTHYHLANDWQVDESTVRRTTRAGGERTRQERGFPPAGAQGGGRRRDRVERCGRRRDGAPRWAAEKKQRRCYSGKKKRHTLKSQVAVDRASGRIVAAACGKGRTHDFRLFKRSRLRLHPATALLADSGYQGVAKLHAKSRTPFKRWRGRALSEGQKAHNRALAGERVLAENVIRRLKVFRLLKETYRHRCRRFIDLQLSKRRNWEG
jgi:DDE superfamily endonuclease/Helix-turn-helix of DDE superfamily endonuclease